MRRMRGPRESVEEDRGGGPVGAHTANAVGLAEGLPTAAPDTPLPVVSPEPRTPAPLREVAAWRWGAASGWAHREGRHARGSVPSLA